MKIKVILAILGMLIILIGLFFLETKTNSDKKTIVLMAHNSQKEKLIQWAEVNKSSLRFYKIISDIELNDLEVYPLQSKENFDKIIFFIDPEIVDNILEKSVIKYYFTTALNSNTADLIIK